MDDWLDEITGALSAYGDYKTANNTAAAQTQLANAQLAATNAANTAAASNTRLMIMMGGAAVLLVVAVIALKR